LSSRTSDATRDLSCARQQQRTSASIFRFLGVGSFSSDKRSARTHPSRGTFPASLQFPAARARVREIQRDGRYSPSGEGSSGNHRASSDRTDWKSRSNLLDIETDHFEPMNYDQLINRDNGRFREFARSCNHRRGNRRRPSKPHWNNSPKSPPTSSQKFQAACGDPLFSSDSFNLESKQPSGTPMSQILSKIAILGPVKVPQMLPFEGPKCLQLKRISKNQILKVATDFERQAREIGSEFSIHQDIPSNYQTSARSSPPPYPAPLSSFTSSASSTSFVWFPLLLSLPRPEPLFSAKRRK